MVIFVAFQTHFYAPEAFLRLHCCLCLKWPILEYLTEKFLFFFLFTCPKHPRGMLHMNHVSYYLLIPDREAHTLTSKLTLILVILPNIAFLSEHISTTCPLHQALLWDFALFRCIFFFLQKTPTLSFRFYFILKTVFKLFLRFCNHE